MRTLLIMARSIVGLLQSILVLGGCVSILVAPQLLGATVVGFLLLCGVQVGILILAALFVREP